MEIENTQTTTSTGDVVTTESTEPKTIEETMYGDTQNAETQPQETDDGTSAVKVEEKKQESEGEFEAYELKMEDGSLLTEEYVKQFHDMAIKNKVPKEQAEKYLQQQSNLLGEYQDRLDAQHEQEVNNWREMVSNDPELGGQNLPQTIERAKSAIREIAKPELVELLESTGYGNHPAVVHLFNEIGKRMQPDKLVTGNAGNTPKTVEELFYSK